jgi:hypothetical protein
MYVVVAASQGRLAFVSVFRFRWCRISWLFIILIPSGAMASVGGPYWTFGS